jgi:uncharacterized protein involved in outer membrane biogenesis
MTLRWLHRSWVYFWNSIGILILVSIVLGGITYGVIQLPASKNYISKNIEDSFNSDRQAVLKIGELGGHIPFSITLTDVYIFSDSTLTNHVVSIDSMKASIDLRGWFTRQLIIPSLEVIQPVAILNVETDYGSIFSKSSSNEDLGSNIDEINSDNIEFVFPFIAIRDGEVRVDNLNFEDSLFINTETLSFSDISMNTYFEYGSTQRFIDIEQFSFGIPEANIDRINVFGQIFNDERYLEFNVFNLSTKNNAVRFSAEFDGINLLEPNLSYQLKESRFDISLDELITYPKNLKKLFVGIPETDQQLYATVQAQGSTDSVTVNDLYFLLGNTELNAYGGLRLADEFGSEYGSFAIERLSIDSLDLKSWATSLTKIQNTAISESEIEGEFYGSLDNLNTAIRLNSSRGELSLLAHVDRRDSMFVDIKGRMNELNIGYLFNPNLEFTSLNGDLRLQSNSLEFESAQGDLNLALTKGALNAFDFDSLDIKTNWKEGIFTPFYALTSETAFLNGDGRLSFADSTKEIELNGTASQLNLKALTNSAHLSSSLVDLNYDVSLNGSDINNAFGVITVDLPNTIVDGDTLKNHQIYADFSSTNEDGKSFRLTSTPLDFSLRGDFEPFNVIELTQFWFNNINQKINEEVLFRDSD